MQQMLKKLGMNMVNIQANRVIIKTDAGDITIENPEVIKTTMKDQVVFQISGNVKEKSISDEDVKLIMEQTNVKDEEKIKKLLYENDGDVAKTIMQLKKFT